MELLASVAGIVEEDSKNGENVNITSSNYHKKFIQSLANVMRNPSFHSGRVVQFSDIRSEQKILPFFTPPPSPDKTIEISSPMITSTNNTSPPIIKKTQEKIRVPLILPPIVPDTNPFLFRPKVVEKKKEVNNKNKLNIASPIKDNIKGKEKEKEKEKTEMSQVATAAPVVQNTDNTTTAKSGISITMPPKKKKKVVVLTSPYGENDEDVEVEVLQTQKTIVPDTPEPTEESVVAATPPVSPEKPKTTLKKRKITEEEEDDDEEEINNNTQDEEEQEEESEEEEEEQEEGEEDDEEQQQAPKKQKYACLSGKLAKIKLHGVMKQFNTLKPPCDIPVAVCGLLIFMMTKMREDVGKPSNEDLKHGQISKEKEVRNIEILKKILGYDTTEVEELSTYYTPNKINTFVLYIIRTLTLLYEPYEGSINSKKREEEADLIIFNLPSLKVLAEKYEKAKKKKTEVQQLQKKKTDSSKKTPVKKAVPVVADDDFFTPVVSAPPPTSKNKKQQEEDDETDTEVFAKSKKTITSKQPQPIQKVDSVAFKRLKMTSDEDEHEVWMAYPMKKVERTQVSCVMDEYHLFVISMKVGLNNFMSREKIDATDYEKIKNFIQVKIDKGCLVFGTIKTAKSPAWDCPIHLDASVFSTVLLGDLLFNKVTDNGMSTVTSPLQKLTNSFATTMKNHQ